MKTMTTVISLALFSMLSFNAAAESVTAATGRTLDSTEALIAKAQEAGASGYKITSAYMGNFVTMSAELKK